MNTRLKFRTPAALFVLFLFVVCVVSLCSARAASSDNHRKAKKPAQLPPLPSGPLGPVPQIPLDSIAPVAPQVNFENGQLTIVALNSTLGDILRAVRKHTGAEIEFPAINERVVIHLGPGPAREVIAELLNGSRFNYVLIGSPEDPTQLTRIVLVLKAASETATPNRQPGGQVQPQHVTMQVVNQMGNIEPPQAPTADPDAVGDDPEFSPKRGAEAAQQPLPQSTSPPDPE